MSGVLAVVPILDHSYGMACLDTIAASDSAAGLGDDQVLVIDNTRDGMLEQSCRHEFRTYRDPDGHNLGVARSWNVGVRESLRLGYDYTLLMSASMRFGPILHTTFTRQMEQFWGANVIECDGHSWHLIAIHRRVFERVGMFDENFYPAYEEAIDFGYRMRLVGMEGGWSHAWVNALSAGAAYHARMVSTPNGPLQAYYAEKWGGPKGGELFDTPWNTGDLGYFPETSIPELAVKYGLEVWW